MYFAIGVEPTKLTASTSGCVSSASTATLSPCTTLNTPFGRPACASHSASSSEAEGSRSDGLSTKQLPQAMAIGNIHSGTIAGKLNGVMPATTPSGWRSEYASTWLATFSVVSPLSRCGIPQANSTTSRPRATSPSASEWVLPCSAVIWSAKRSALASINSRSLNMTRARRAGGVLAQSGNAARAAATARPTVSTSASGSTPVWAPLAGLNTGELRPPSPSTRWPSM